MTEIYSENDFTNAKKQKKNLLTIYFLILAVALLGCVAILIVYISQPYQTPLKTPLIVAESGITAIMIVFSFIFLGIKFKRASAYYKEMKAIQTGLRETSSCIYDSVGEVNIKDGCDFNTMVFYTWYPKKGKYFKRNVLIDIEKELPKFNSGDIVKFVTQGNVMVSYEVTGHNDEYKDLIEDVTE